MSATAVAPPTQERAAGGAGTGGDGTSASGRPKLSNAGRLGFLGFVFVVIYLPLVVLVLFSFNNSIIVTLPFKGFTLTWYQQIFRDPLVVAALKNSLIVAAFVMPVSLVLGTLAGFGITRFRYRLRGPLAGLIAAPLVVPDLLIGVGALLLFGKTHIQLSLKTIAVMHVVDCFPLVAAIVAARLLRFDPSLEEAALDLGATRREVLRYILLPQLTTALAASAIFAFSWSFNNFTLTFFVGGFQQTFPTWVFSTLAHAKNVPIVNAISTIVTVVQVTLVYIAWKLATSRTESKNKIPDVLAPVVT